MGQPSGPVIASPRCIACTRSALDKRRSSGIKSKVKGAIVRERPRSTGIRCDLCNEDSVSGREIMSFELVEGEKQTRVDRKVFRNDQRSE